MGRILNIHGVNDVRLDPIEPPRAGAQDVVVKVRACGICGSDLHIWRGDGFLSAMGRADGRIIGHEMTGVVHALGAGVTTDWAGNALAEGDRVVVAGTESFENATRVAINQ